MSNEALYSRVVQAEKSIYAELMRRYSNLGKNLVFDGIGNPKHYFGESQRVVFVLREPNGYPGADIRGQLNQGPKFNVWHRVAEWAAGMRAGFPDRDALTNKTKKFSLSAIAVINVKKLPGAGRADLKEIDNAAFRHRDLLRRQIKLCDPHIILACGTYSITRWLLSESITGERAVENRMLASMHDSKFIIEWRHPGRSPKSSYDELAKVYEGLSA